MKKMRMFSLLMALLLLLAGCSAPQEKGDNGGGEIIHITNQNFEEAVLNSKKTVLLDFYADWCGPCKQLAPILEEIAAENPNVVIGKIDVDNELILSSRFQIEAMPTLVVIKDGEEVARTVGLRSKSAILSMLG